jgi:hypothetical protein
LIPENEIRLAGKAQEVLEHEAFKHAFSTVENALLTAMTATPIENDKMKLRLVDKYEALQSLKACLQSMVDTGLMAEEQLKRKTISQRVKEFVYG